uniref:Metalloendopeptidase n=1 Tax=Parastrongyloides trichosuri TaxID=131310 RepID=A0A0N4Z443_PARTI
MEIYLIILFFVLIPKIIVVSYKEEVRKAVGVIQNETCITFQETNDLSGPGLRFTQGRGCGSLIGRDPKNIPQSITIMDNCRFYTYIMHEIGHALGLVHEMKRPDRNNYIIVNKSNIKYGTYDQLYNMYSSSQVITHNLKYDYGSLMHYRYNAFSNGRGHTIIPKDTNYFNTIGQRIELGFNDVKNLNLYYCSDKCKNSLPCKVGGYPDPNNCKICKCPRFYTGTYCQSILKSSSGCGISKLEAKSYIKYVKFDGIKSCYLLITTNSKYKIELTISGIFRSYDCKPHSGLEVKYYSDKSVSGAIL